MRWNETPHFPSLGRIDHEGVQMYPGKWAAMNPDKPALIMADTEEMITYAQLEERSLRLANYMRSIGFEKGDHLAVMAENRIASASARSPPAQPLKRSPDGRTTNRCSPRHPRRSPNTNLVATTCSTHRERPGDPRASCRACPISPSNPRTCLSSGSSRRSTASTRTPSTSRRRRCTIRHRCASSWRPSPRAGRSW